MHPCQNLSQKFVFCRIELGTRSEEHTSELQSRLHLVCRLLLEKKKANMLTNLHPSQSVQASISQCRKLPFARRRTAGAGIASLARCGTMAEPAMRTDIRVLFVG